MSAQATVTLNTVDYLPAGVAGNLATWLNREDGVPAAFSPLTQSLSSPSVNGKVYRVIFKLAIPVVAEEDTTCACAGALLRTNQFEGTFLLATTSTTAERTDLYLRVKDLVASAAFIAAVENLVNPTS